MKKLSAPLGAVVRVWFPESECVLKPGPKFRPALVLDVSSRNGRQQALVAYGTSQHTERCGRGEFTVPASLSTSLESDTKFCLMRRVWLPLTREYFTAGKDQPEPEPIVQKSYSKFKRAAEEAELL